MAVGYTAIPDSDIDPDSPGTTSLFTLLRDNPIAITEGASGAPKNTKASLTTSTVSLAGNIAGTSYVDIALTAYCFFPMIHTTGLTNDIWVRGNTSDLASADSPTFGLWNQNVSTINNAYDVDYRYIST